VKCSDPACKRRATRELRSIPMCEAYYIEALEHGAHLDFGQWDGKAGSLYLDGRTTFYLEMYPREPEAPQPLTIMEAK